MDEETGMFSGYAAFFGNKDSYGEVITKNAFDSFMSQDGEPVKGVKLLWQHRQDEPIGVWKSMEIDENGLMAHGKLLIQDVQRAREAYALMKEGAISGLSIGFRVKKDGWIMGEEDNIKYLTDIDLIETSIVTFPSNTRATITNVKDLSGIKTIRDFEESLRDVGASKQEARALASLASKMFGQRDAEKTTENLERSLDRTIKLLTKGI